MNLKPRNIVQKAHLLSRLLVNNPLEVLDRVLTFLEYRFEPLWVRPGTYAPQEWPTVVAGIEQTLGIELAPFLDEPACTELTAAIQHRLDEMRQQATAFAPSHNADTALARLCYGVCRATKPATVVETGVAHGVTSAFILRALDMNGSGRLHSIDLPPLHPQAEAFVGILVPAELQHRWWLHRGPGKRLVPLVLRELKEVDVFVHDSLHTYHHMRMEFQMALAHLRRPGVVISDDIGGNPAFQQLNQGTSPAFWATMKEPDKGGLCGVSVFV